MEIWYLGMMNEWEFSFFFVNLRGIFLFLETETLSWISGLNLTLGFSEMKYFRKVKNE